MIRTMVDGGVRGAVDGFIVCQAGLAQVGGTCAGGAKEGLITKLCVNAGSLPWLLSNRFWVVW